MKHSKIISLFGHLYFKLKTQPMKILYLITYLLCTIPAFSQVSDQPNKKSKFFISAGYGLAGSFFVRSYYEFAPIQQYKTFYKKNFVGVAQNIAVGINLKNNYTLKAGVHFQHFTRKVNSSDTLNGVIVLFDHTIHHRDYMFFAGLNKSFTNSKHIFSPGLGLYYIRPQQEDVEIYDPYFVTNIERNYKNSRLEEGGVYAELEYEYKFQPKVHLGIKTQFYYTVSTGESESVTLYPFIRILL